MVSAKRLAQLAKKWQRMAALGRKRLTAKAKENEECCTSAAVKGHCIMYTADGKRFEVPLVYLSTMVFGELLRMSQEEFGFASDGKITLPCDAGVMGVCHVFTQKKYLCRGRERVAQLNGYILSLHWLRDANCKIQPANLLHVAPEEHAHRA